MLPEMLIFAYSLSGFLDSLSQRMPAEPFREYAENHLFQIIYVFLSQRPFMQMTFIHIIIAQYYFQLLNKKDCRKTVLKITFNS